MGSRQFRISRAQGGSAAHFWKIMVCIAMLPGARIASGTAAGAAPQETRIGQTPDGFGGGEYVVAQELDEPTLEQRREIWSAIRANVEMLQRGGRLPERTLTHPFFGWPLAPWNGLSNYGYHGISGFVDQNPAFPNARLDWNCGARTYDLASGYNHQGVDFFTWPFGWYKMDNSQVAVVAAAPGTIVYKSDGNFDRSCAMGSGNWNAVYVLHADASIAWYGHMKSGSVTTKAVGESVAQGEYLGIVGSSGSSTGPHLHLEVYDSSGLLNEPYAGPCNSMNATSWWASQRPYYDSALNHLATNSAPPTFPSCPNQETPNEQNVFPLGATVYFLNYYRDQRSGQTSTYRIYRPDGVPAVGWTHGISDPHYAASWWYWSFSNFAPSGPEGVWRYEVTYESRTYRHYFAMGGPPASGRVTGQLIVTELPSGQVSLQWGSSCMASDNTYEVYEGTLGQFSSHIPRTCSTEGARNYVLTPQPHPEGSGSYFLVAPTNTICEGSLGTNSSGLERPTGPSPCRPQVVASCP